MPCNGSWVMRVSEHTIVQRSLCSSIMGSEVSSRHEFATSLSSLAQRGRWSRVGVVSLSRGSLIRSYVAELAWLVQANFRVSKTLTLFVAKSTVYLAFIAVVLTCGRAQLTIDGKGMQCILVYLECNACCVVTVVAGVHRCLRILF